MPIRTNNLVSRPFARALAHNKNKTICLEPKIDATLQKIDYEKYQLLLTNQKCSTFLSCIVNSINIKKGNINNLSFYKTPNVCYLYYCLRRIMLHFSLQNYIFHYINSLQDENSFENLCKWPKILYRK